MNVTTNEEWQQKKYIYLDWNVYRYMIQPRSGHEEEDKRLLALVKKLKKKYLFPYSEGHIKDRANRYKSEYRAEIESDFQFVEEINNSYVLLSGEAVQKKQDIVIAQCSMKDYFDEYLKMRDEKGDTKIVPPKKMEFEDFQVDMDKIDGDHPLRDFLLKHKGLMSASNYEEYLEDMLSTIFYDDEMYRKIRKHIQKLDVDDLYQRNLPFKERLQLDQLLYYMAPMIESRDYDEDTLAAKWSGIVDQWAKAAEHELNFERKIKEGYTLLDFHPLFKDKLKKGKNTLDNIVRDGSHCFYASKAAYFVSEDENTRKKTELIYTAYGIKTKVVNISKFLGFFDGTVD